MTRAVLTPPNYSYAYRQAAEAFYEQFVKHKYDVVKDTMGTKSIVFREVPVSSEEMVLDVTTHRRPSALFEDFPRNSYAFF